MWVLLQWPRVGRVCPGLRGDARVSSTASKREPCRLTRHKNIQHTVRYTELSPGRFKDFWR